MSKLRFRVVESAFEKKATELTTPAERPSEYYGELVFNREKMFKYLPERAYERLVDSIDNGTPLDRETANAVASGMKKWAMEKRRYPLHPLVPSLDGRYSREARCFHRARWQRRRT